MKEFELFSLIFLLLDERWQQCRDMKLGHFLSEMNPYAWESEDSADPAVYEEFKGFMSGRTIGEDNGFSLVGPYLDTVTYYPDLKDFLSDVDQNVWNYAVRQFMNQDHKGGEK